MIKMHKQWQRETEVRQGPVVLLCDERLSRFAAIKTWWCKHPPSKKANESAAVYSIYKQQQGGKNYNGIKPSHWSTTPDNVPDWLLKTLALTEVEALIAIPELLFQRAWIPSECWCATEHCSNIFNYSCLLAPIEMYSMYLLWGAVIASFKLSRGDFHLLNALNTESEACSVRM